MGHTGLKQSIDAGMIGCLRCTPHQPRADCIPADEWAGQRRTELECESAFASAWWTSDDDEWWVLWHVRMIAWLFRCAVAIVLDRFTLT